MKTIVVIPARGGSKGIPRKNLRPLAGKPMIYYSIKASLAADLVDRVVVSTDDDEIALLSKRFGADVLMRPKQLADDVTTLDPVIECAVKQAEEKWKEKYDVIVTVQPTSPLITEKEVNSAIEFLREGSNDTVLSVVDDRHLRWTIENGRPKPQYTARMNRQQLPANYKETGAIIVCTRKQLSRGTRIGSKIHLLEIKHEQSFDIDTFADLALCESLLNRKKIVFAVVGYDKVGLGHVYRALMLANELVNYDIQFICEEHSQLAAEYIRKQNYSVSICDNGTLSESCIDLSPDLVINDILDTDIKEIRKLKEAGIKVVNFEDMGSGFNAADLVINALYPHQIPSGHVLVGPKYFCLRDEFLYLPDQKRNDRVEKVLLTFGGVDEGNLTIRCIDLLGQYFISNKIKVDIVTGPGYRYESELQECLETLSGLDVSVSMGTQRISDFMCDADLAMTSGGRTVLELAALQVPTIVICQNRRETTHTFASSDNGILNLGFREEVSDIEIKQAVEQVITDCDLLRVMRKKASNHDLTKGKKRVIERIEQLLQE